MNRMLVGIHAVREALRAETPLHWIAVSRDRQDARIQEIVRMARVAGVQIRTEETSVLDRHAGSAGRHQGVVAQAEARPVVALEDLMADKPADGGQPGLLVALDGIEDPHNLGAILRSASGAGVDGVLLPSRRSVGLTETVDRVAAGALEYLRVARVGSLAQSLEKLKKSGYWSVGLDAEAGASYWEHDFSIPTVLVVGAEGFGMHELTRKTCDFLVSIPLAGGIESLNASVATGIVLYEALRQRRVANSKRLPVGL